MDLAGCIMPSAGKPGNYLGGDMMPMIKCRKCGKPYCESSVFGNGCCGVCNGEGGRDNRFTKEEAREARQEEREDMAEEWAEEKRLAE